MAILIPLIHLLINSAYILTQSGSCPFCRHAKKRGKQRKRQHHHSSLSVTGRIPASHRTRQTHIHKFKEAELLTEHVKEPCICSEMEYQKSLSRFDDSPFKAAIKSATKQKRTCINYTCVKSTVYNVAL